MIFRRRRKTLRGTRLLVELDSVRMRNGVCVPVIYPVETPCAERDLTFIDNWMSSFVHTTKTGGTSSGTSHS